MRELAKIWHCGSVEWTRAISLRRNAYQVGGFLPGFHWSMEAGPPLEGENAMSKNTRGVIDSETPRYTTWDEHSMGRKEKYIEKGTRNTETAATWAGLRSGLILLITSNWYIIFTYIYEKFPWRRTESARFLLWFVFFCFVIHCPCFPSWMFVTSLSLSTKDEPLPRNLDLGLTQPAKRNWYWYEKFFFSWPAAAF